MRSITHRALTALTLAALTSLSGCIEVVVDDDDDTGTIGVNLVGQGSSGATFRLRDATITVDGAASSQVWNTEDDPDQTSLSANVVVGPYTATLASGWRLERLVPGAAPVTVTATLESANPVGFEVASQLRTAVPLRFRVDDGVIDMTQGYDITLDVDDPTTAIAVSATALTLPEGSVASFTARLSRQPAGTVSVSLASSNLDAATVAPASLIFTPADYAQPQQVTVLGAPDADLLDEAATLSLSGPGLSPATVEVLVLDTDTQAIVTTTPALELTEGETATIGVRLAAQPAASVTVSAVTASNAVAGVTPTSLTFTPANYDIVQLVTVTAAQDSDSPPSNGSTTITLSAGLTISTVAVTVFDDDVITMSPGNQSLCPGDLGVVTVRLLAAPPTARTFTVTASNPARVAVSPTSLTFTPGNWWNDQVVNVDALSTGSSLITVSGPGGSPTSVSVTVRSSSAPVCLL